MYALRRVNACALATDFVHAPLSKNRVALHRVQTGRIFVYFVIIVDGSALYCAGVL